MSNYPDNMSDFNHDPASPEYSPRKKKVEKEFEHEDWDDAMREGDINREEDYNRDKDYDCPF